MRLIKFIKENVSYICYIGFAFLFTAGLTLGTKTDYDIWFHLRAGEYFFQTGSAPTIPIDAWYAQAQNIYWVSHEWLFGVFAYKLMELNPVYVNLLPTILLSLLTVAVAIYNRKLFKENPAIAFTGIMLLAMVTKIGNTPRPHLFAYFFTFFLFVILKKDIEEEGNTVYWLLPLTVLWVNMHGGSYLLLFVFSLINIIIGSFNLQLGKIEFKKSSNNQQLKRIAIFIVCLALVSVNAHGLNMYFYPLTNFADNLMQSSISEWNAPDLKVGWQIYIYITTAIFFTSLIATNKKIKAFDLITGMAYVYLGFRSIRFAPQMTIVIMMIVGNYIDSLSFINVFSKKLTLFFSASMLLISTISIVPGITEFNQKPLFGLDKFPSDNMIETIKELKPERFYNPYNCGGYLTYKGLDVFIDGRADIYTTINLKDALDIQRGNYKYLDLINKYNFDYMLVQTATAIDTFLKLDSNRFELIMDENGYRLYRIKYKTE